MSKQKKLKLDSMLNEILAKVESIQEEVKEIKTHILQNTNNESTNQNLLFDKNENQNVNGGNILAEQTVALKSTITSLWQNPKHLQRFPIDSDDALQEWENAIDDENKCGMIHAVKCIVGKNGLRKNLKLILSPNLVLTYNLHGSHTKKRLYNFSKIMDVLLHDMRKATKDIKNRYFKDVYVKKKLKDRSPTIKSSVN